MSYTYTKLFSSITASTVWCESSDIRVVWITMLAMADQYGRVFGSIPGLAGIARVPVETCRGAVGKFLAPDADSRTPEHEGRRIEPIDGGWQLLNHAKYRGVQDEQNRRVKAAERQKRYRDRNANSNAVTRDVTQSNAIAEAYTDTDKAKSKASVSRKRATALPKPFEMTAEWVETAERLGAVNGSAQAVFDGFCDYWWGCGKAKLDWLAVWRTWLRKEFKTGAVNGKGNRATHPRQSLAEASAEDERRGDAYYGPLGDH